MATKVTKEISAQEALTQAVGEHVETLTDAEGYPVKVARVALVGSTNAATGESTIVAQPLRGYHLKAVDREWLEGAANAAHTLRKIGE